ncbi:transglutaminase family protein [Trichlorobacter lovleyi]|uniref:transglutaminase-like domain-containing protein n=1 Tax=Trichlorobacter lovleyi TaxID=313985 RepID=UPI0024800DF8|nr:transglutaminase-like domain-containing protein [Trichlorobacter lovleyi]
MFHRHSMIIAAIALFFFTWTSGGISGLAHAAKLEVNKPAAKVTQQSPQKHPRIEERFAKVTEELESALADTKADVGRKRKRLKAGDDEINKLDVEMRAQFAATEQKLRDSKLPAKILERHAKFVKHYDDNLNELRGNIARVEKAKDHAGVQMQITRVHDQLKRIKAPTVHEKLDPNNMPNRKRAIVWRDPRTKKEEFDKDFKKDKQAWSNQPRIMVAANGSLAGLLTSSNFNAIILPAAEDLAETTDVKFTPEIQAKALELGNNPVKIYEWVRNNFKFEPYYGSLKGAQQTLLEMSGNDFDQASLLIALLRSANIPAHYVYGTIELPAERAMAWLGVRDPKVAGDIIASGSIPATGIKDSNGKIITIRLEHVWVEAFVNMYPSFGGKPGQGNAWTPIDPSFKEQELNNSIDVSKTVKFDETGYLSKQSTISPTLSYLQALDDYHSANYQSSKSEMYYLKRIKPLEFGHFMGTLPYQTVVVASKFSAIAQSMRHTMTIGLTDPQTNTRTEVTKNISDLVGKKITVSYVPATSQDSDVIEGYGGLLNTPAYLIHVKTVVKIDETVVLEGPEIGMGKPLKLSATFGGQGRPDETIDTDMSAGIYYNIGLSALNVADKQASTALDNSSNLLTTFFESINTDDGQTGKVLHNIAMQYFTHTNNDSRVLEGVMQIHNTRSANAGFVSVTAKYSYTMGVPTSPPQIAGLLMDLRRFIQSPFSITGDANQEIEFTKIQGLSTSFYEHAIWESFSGIASVSTVKLLQMAKETGTPIYSINSANINDTLPLLNQSPQIKTDIQNAITAGRVVTIPASAVTLNEWHGTGYMARNPNTGEGAYIISNGYAGGGSSKSPAPNALGLLARQYAAIAEGRPAAQVSIKNSGYWIEASFDEYFSIAIMFRLLGKGYIPKFLPVSSKKEFLDYVNDNSNVIFYYSGHSTSRYCCSHLPPDLPIGDMLIPSYDSNNKPEYVFPSEIHSNARIVFFNSCKSARDGSFLGSLGPANEVFLGWNDSTGYVDAGYFAYRWWSNLIEGKTAVEAATGIDNGKYTSNPAGLMLRIFGDAYL